MQLNQEGWLLIGVFAFLFLGIAIGFLAYGRRDLRHLALNQPALFSALELLGAEPALLLLFCLPACFALQGAQASYALLGLVLGFALALLLRKRLCAMLEQSGHETVTQWLCSFGKGAAVAACVVHIVFAGALGAAGMALLARLICAAFALSYEISCWAACALVALFAYLYAGEELLRRAGVLRGAALVLGCGLLVFLQGKTAEAPMGAAASLALDSSALHVFVFLGLFAMPLFGRRLYSARLQRTPKAGPLLAGALLLGCTALLALAFVGRGEGMGIAAELELTYFNLALDGFHPLLASLFLWVPLALGLFTAVESLRATTDAVYAAAKTLAPTWEEGRIRPMAEGGIVLLALLMLVPTLQPFLSMYALLVLAAAGFGGAVAPLLIAGLLGWKIDGKTALCGMVAGGGTALAWTLLPVLSAFVPAILPAVALGFAAVLIAGRGA